MKLPHLMWSVFHNFYTFTLLTLFMAMFGYHVQLPNLVLNITFTIIIFSVIINTSSTVIGMHILYSLINIFITDFSLFEYLNQCKCFYHKLI